MIHIARPYVDDDAKQAVMAVLDSGLLAQGQLVRQLEEEFAAYIGVDHAVAVSSGTAALMLALVARGIGPGDEVITTPFSFVATANAVLYAGARPVFVDVTPDDGLIDPARVEAAITSATKAVLPVHLYGRACDMTALARVAERHNLAIIEDAAQAHGAAWNGRKAGSFGAGCFSFYATKNISSGEGGIVTTNDGDLAQRVRHMRDHGQDGRYHHVALGYNFRMTEIEAALAVHGLRALPAGNAARRENAAFLTQRLRGVATPVDQGDDRHVYHQYTIRVNSGRDDLARHLRGRGIETAVHYPLLIPDQPYYRSVGPWGSFPNAARLTRQVLSLPVHPLLTRQDLDQIVEAVNSWTERGNHDRAADTDESTAVG